MVRARILIRQPTVVMASDTAFAKVRVDGIPYSVFSELLDSGLELQIVMDSVQVLNDGGNRYTWASWSNGQPRSFTYTSSSTGDTIIGNVTTEYLLQATVAGPGGAVTSSPAVDHGPGEFLTPDTVVTLVADMEQAGILFEGWTGDTVASSDTLEIRMTRRFRVTAVFASQLTIPQAALDDAVMGAMYSEGLSAEGGTGSYAWTLTGGELPPGVSLATNGQLSGRPEETGTFTFTADVASGSQTESQSFDLEVVAPALTVADVVQQIVGLSNTLSADEIRYMQLLGNGNDVLDVGDFLAWVEATGATPSAAAMAAVMAVEEERNR